MGAFLTTDYEVSNKRMFRKFISSQVRDKIMFDIFEHEILVQDIVEIHNSETNKEIAIMYVNYDSQQNIICISINLSYCLDDPTIYYSKLTLNFKDCIGIEQDDIENINHFSIRMNFRRCLELIIKYCSPNKLENVVVI